MSLGSVTLKKVNCVSWTLLSAAIPKQPNGVDVKYCQTPNFRSTKKDQKRKRKELKKEDEEEAERKEKENYKKINS